MNLRRSYLSAYAFALALAVGAWPAAAEQLGKEACEGVKTEQAALVTAGIKTDMDKGAEWAKANLPPERMQQVARYIELEEQLTFRCKVLTLPPRKKDVAATTDPKQPKAAAMHVAPQDTAPAAGGAMKPPAVIRLKPAAKPGRRPAR